MDVGPRPTQQDVLLDLRQLYAAVQPNMVDKVPVYSWQPCYLCEVVLTGTYRADGTRRFLKAHPERREVHASNLYVYQIKPRRDSQLPVNSRGELWICEQCARREGYLW